MRHHSNVDRDREAIDSVRWVKTVSVVTSGLPLSEHEARELADALRADDPHVKIVLVGVDARARDEPDGVTVEASDAKLAVTLHGDRCPLDELEREVIRQAMIRCRGNISRAARYLDITRQTLVYRLRKHGFTSEELEAL
jgi:transcriptional regulator of acetoin/glycerol metabolism